MACSITITSVIGIPAVMNGTTTATINVTGTQIGCPPIFGANIIVEVDCGGGPVSAQVFDSSGTWAVDVPATCTCGANITVTATCATNADC